MARAPAEKEVTADVYLLDILAVLLRAGRRCSAGGAVDDDGRATVQEQEEWVKAKSDESCVIAGRPTHAPVASLAAGEGPR